MLSFRGRFLFLALAVLIVLHAVGALDPAERAIVGVLRPLQQRLAALVPRAGPATPTADERLRELEAQVSRLLTENILLKEERRGVQASNEQQSFLERRSLSGQTVSIIGRSPEGDDQIVVLDRGSERGITSGQPVITEDGILIGTVLESEAGRSIAVLITDRRSSVAVEVENTQRSPGLVRGQHGLTMVMEFIPQNEPIERQQAVVTSAVDERIPANLPVGVISDVHFATGDLFQTASLRPLIDLRRLRYVTVIIS
ncbi:MAG: rod shape-determining protein MreC [Candidatus Kerfeldbacteria bacterium]|nr:rod shape-determining protein MreC [Candidatus Kerfeldbacteria bacterium]